MEIGRKWRFSCLLLGLFFLATTLQGVQGEVESEGPSESECRPYIEKALKELETAEAEHLEPRTPSDGDGESTEDNSIVEQTIDDSEHTPSDGEDDIEETETKDAEQEEASTEQEATEGEEVAASAEQAEDQPAEEQAGESLEDVEQEQADEPQAESAEQAAEASAEQQEGEAAEADETIEEQASVEEAEATESVEHAAESVEEPAGSQEVAEDAVVEEGKSVEDVAEGEEEQKSVEDVAEGEEEQKSAEEADTEKSVEEAAASAEETAAASAEETAGEDAAASTEDATGSVEDAAGSVEEAAASVEDAAASVEEEAAEAEDTAASVEDAAASVEDTAASVEEAEDTVASVEDAAASVEEAATSAEEAAASVEEAAASVEDAAASVEDAAASVEEAAASAEEAAASAEKAAASAEEAAAASAEETTAASAEEAAASAEETAASVEDVAEEAAASVEETAALVEEAGASVEEGGASVEEAEETGASIEEGEKSAEEAGKSAEIQEEGEAKIVKRSIPDQAEEGKSAEAGADEGSLEELAEPTEEEKEVEIAEEEPKEEVPEEDLTIEMEIPEDLRPRDHIAQLLKLDDAAGESILDRISEVTLRELKRLYEGAIKPLETLYKYRDLSNRHFGDSEIFSKPLVLFMGPWSGGKSSIINYLVDNEYNSTSLRTGAEPSPAYFNILMHGDEPEVLDGTQLAADFTFAGLQKFGQGLEERLRGLKLPSKLLEKINIVEIPGILEVRKQVSRIFPFNDACQWFIDRADIIFLVYDPSKLDVGPETEAILDQLKGREHQTRIVLNKADQVKPEELMRVQSALIWNISPLMSSAQPPVMYTTSLWSRPYETWAPVRLLQAQERAFLRDLRSAVDKRIENKISSARRFAVRVRNHAKMVDCYLTTYYNHKSVFGNRKQVSDQIIEHPQDYHIYEGLSTLTNISRYDLPDPDVYRDFFRLNPLYDFQQLSATCTYFRGCPINRLDVAIAYDLPEMVGKHKKSVDAALAELKTES